MGGFHHGAGMAMAAASRPLGDDTGDIRYPLYLANGRQARAPATLATRPGEGSGFGSSTRPPTRRSGWPWAAIA
jgi:hypothetical protein